MEKREVPNAKEVKSTKKKMCWRLQRTLGEGPLLLCCVGRGMEMYPLAGRPIVKVLPLTGALLLGDTQNAIYVVAPSLPLTGQIRCISMLFVSIGVLIEVVALSYAIVTFYIK